MVSHRYRDPESIQGQVSDILPSYQEQGISFVFVYMPYMILTFRTDDHN